MELIKENILPAFIGSVTAFISIYSMHCNDFTIASILLGISSFCFIGIFKLK